MTSNAPKVVKFRTKDKTSGLPSPEPESEFFREHKSGSSALSGTSFEGAKAMKVMAGPLNQHRRRVSAINNRAMEQYKHFEVEFTSREGKILRTACA